MFWTATAILALATTSLAQNVPARSSKLDPCLCLCLCLCLSAADTMPVRTSPDPRRPQIRTRLSSPVLSSLRQCRLSTPLRLRPLLTPALLAPPPVCLMRILIASDLRQVAQVGNVTAEHRLEGLGNSLTRQGAAAQRLDVKFSAIPGVLLVTRDAILRAQREFQVLASCRRNPSIRCRRLYYPIDHLMTEDNQAPNTVPWCAEARHDRANNLLRCHAHPAKQTWQGSQYHR